MKFGDFVFGLLDTMPVLYPQISTFLMYEVAVFFLLEVVVP